MVRSQEVLGARNRACVCLVYYPCCVCAWRCAEVCNAHGGVCGMDLALEAPTELYPLGSDAGDPVIGQVRGGLLLLRFSMMVPDRHASTPCVPCSLLSQEVCASNANPAPLRVTFSP